MRIFRHCTAPTFAIAETESATCGRRLGLILGQAVIFAVLMGAYVAFPSAASAEINVAPVLPALAPTADFEMGVEADVNDGDGFHFSEIDDDVY